MFRRIIKTSFLLVPVSVLFWPKAAFSGDVILTKSITSELRYDNNANISPDRNTREDDYVLILSPSASVETNVGKANVNAQYKLSWAYFFKNPSLNAMTHYLNAGLNTKLTERTNLEATERFIYTKESLEANIIGIQTTRGNIWSNAVTLGLDHALTMRNSVSLTLSDGVMEYQSENTSRSRTDSAGVGWGFAATPRTSLSASYTYTFRHLEARGQTNNFASHSAQAGFANQLFPSLRVSLSGGAVYTPTLENEQFDWSVVANINKSFERSFLNLGYTRGISDTSGLSPQLNIHEIYSAQYNTTITQNTSLNLYGNYSRNRSKPTTVVNLNSYSAGISGEWRPREWLRVETGVSHFEQDSLGPVGNKFTREHVFLNITATSSGKL